MLWLFCVGFINANAQQVVSFLNKSKSRVHKYSLPQKVTLKSNIGEIREAILTNVNGDTLYFKSLKNKSDEFSIRYSQIKSIKFHHNAEVPLYIGKYAFIALGTGLTLVGTISLLHGYSNVESSEIYRKFGASLLFGGLGSFLVSSIFNSGLPKEFNFKNNTLKVNN
jgi:hypothetical protein